MKTYIADEGNVFVQNGKILGKILYTPDDFDENGLTQIIAPVEEKEEVEK